MDAWEQKREEENTKRIAAGKKAKTRNKFFLGEWLMEVGEAPVIYDSLLARNSSKQISLFLASKGYFYNSVHDTVTLKGKKAKVSYAIKVGKPYKNRKITYEIEDRFVGYFVLSDTSNSLLKPGQNYDVDKMQKERDRITRMLNNNGYYFFSKEFIYFKVDSSLNSQLLDITIGVKNNITALPEFPDSLVEAPHQKYFISNVVIDAEFDSHIKTHVVKDTLVYNGYTILYKRKLKFRPSILTKSTFITKGSIYQLSNSEDTYKRLSQLKAFRFVNVQFFKTPGRPDSLVCNIQLSPILKQSLTAETEGTNRGGNLGVAGSLVYQNKNVLRGAEILEARLRGGLEVQRPLTQQGGNSNIGLKQGIPFNTFEFGPEVNLYIPRFLLPFNVNESKSSNPKTIITTAYNYQHRQEYTRIVNKITFGYSWKESATKTHLINPVEVSLVGLPYIEHVFDSIINRSNNVIIKNAYSPHLVTDTRYSFVYNDQGLIKSSVNHYFRFNFETSGNILRAYYNLTGAEKDKKDYPGSYKTFNIPFSQYLRADVDFRYYKKLAEHHQVAIRAAGGVGKTLENLHSLPFEKSFYSGGANGIRAWQIRSLGPGDYTGKFNFDQIGDMQLEGNIEYRFKLFKQLNGALFVDAGNIWQLKPTQDFPGGNFEATRFYKEIAIGGGIGARLDFSFFIIRLDLGVKMRDPQFIESERWVIGHYYDNKWRGNYFEKHGSDYSFLNFNLGIGYPF